MNGEMLLQFESYIVRTPLTSKLLASEHKLVILGNSGNLSNTEEEKKERTHQWSCSTPWQQDVVVGCFHKNQNLNINVTPAEVLFCHASNRRLAAGNRSGMVS